MNKAVIGLGFGDEGKGKVTSYLCSKDRDAMVVRYSGGQQAGHQVMINDQQHVFSNFGSGTLQGIPTYWSEYCTFDPVGFLNEWKVLLEKGYNTPVMHVHRDSPVTTPYDMHWNVGVEKLYSHGTCGVGVGQTHQRQQDFYSITVKDLFHPTVLRIKLKELSNHYYDMVLDMEEFLEACDTVIRDHFFMVDKIPSGFNYIFEGSQGLLLDQDIGFFPHVTRSNVGTKNISYHNPETFLVTRAYQTRHGNGAMTNEKLVHHIKDNPYEQNFDDGIQGEFRKTLLDIDLLQYAIDSDRGIDRSQSTLVITCLDLITDDYSLTIDGQKVKFPNEYEFVKFIQNKLDIPRLLTGSSPLSEDLKTI